MHARSTSFLVALALAAGGAVRADDFGSHASVALFAGGNTALPGSFRGQTVPFESSTPAGSTVYHDLKFADAYDHRNTMGAEFDYAFSPALTGFGRYGYSMFDGRQHEVGTFFSQSMARTPLRATFDDTHTQEFDLGARYSFLPWARWSPFVGGALGATRLSATRALFPNLGGDGLTRVTLGEANTVFSQRFETGLQFAPLPNFDLRLTAAANHVDADTRSDDPNLALVGLDDTRPDVRSHWDYPVELAAVWNFNG